MHRPRDFDDVLSVIPGARPTRPGEATAPCPVPGHETPEGHLSLRDAGDKCLATCFGPHTYEEICSALGFESLTYLPKDGRPIGSQREIVDTYDYTDVDGRLLSQVVRFAPKGFSQRRPDGNGDWIWDLKGVPRVLYHMPEVVEAIRAERTIYLPEGERDVDTLRGLGLTATTCSMGAGKWRAEYGNSLVGGHVVVLPDKDTAGQEHAAQVCADLHQKARSVRVVLLPNRDGHDVKDATDWVQAGGTCAELEQMADETPEYEPESPGSEVVSPCSLLPFQTARQLAAVVPERPDYVVQGILAAGAVTELDAKVKVGKTTFALAMVADSLEGHPFLGLKTQRRSVLYLTEERTPSFRAVLGRVGLLGRDELHILSLHSVRGIPWPRIVEETVEHAASVGAGVLVVDTISRWAGLKDDSENNAGAAAVALEPLETAAAKGLAVLILRHDRKSGGELGDSGRGSSAFSGAADIVLALRRADTEGHPNRRLLQGVGRFEETPEQLVIELESGQYQVLGTQTNVERKDAADKLLDVLPGPQDSPGPMEKELVELIAMKRSTVQRALADLVGEGKVLKHKGAGETKRGKGYTLAET